MTSNSITRFFNSGFPDPLLCLFFLINVFSTFMSMDLGIFVGYIQYDITNRKVLQGKFQLGVFSFHGNTLLALN